MVHFSQDSETGTLYCYFTELEAGQAAYELEYLAHLLLDAADQLIGLRLDLDDEVTLNQFELALEHEHNRLDMETGYLWIGVSDEEPARSIALEAAAILDLDAEERMLGVDVALPAEYDIAAHMARLAPFMVAIDTPINEGGQVFTLPERTSTSTDDEADALPPPAEDVAPTEDVAPHESLVDATDEQPLAEARLLDHVGFVALVGKPNVGKSTLLNTLLGQKVAIVSPRPQTTRVPVRGVLNRADAQAIFVDTPGIHQPNHKLGQFMVEVAERTLPHADVVCFVVDISQPPSRLDTEIATRVQRTRARKLLVLNKVDLEPRGGSSLEAYQALGPWDMELAISAQSGAGLATLVDEIMRRLPAGHQLYPADQITDQTEQHLVSELVREKVLHFTDQEIPHSVAVEVEEWEQKEHAVYIRLTVNVERDSQKKIVIGAGGQMLKRIGSAARQDVEQALGQRVYLDLWVKVRDNWRDDVSSLGWLGYRAKDWR